MNKRKSLLNPTLQPLQAHQKPTQEVTYNFNLHVVNAMNLASDLIQDGDEIKVMWRRKESAKESETCKVVNGAACVNKDISLKSKMEYNTQKQLYASKLTQVQLFHMKSNKVVAQADLDLSDYIDVELQKHVIELEDVVPRVIAHSDSNQSKQGAAEELIQENKYKMIYLNVQFKSRMHRAQRKDIGGGHGRQEKTNYLQAHHSSTTPTNTTKRNVFFPRERVSSGPVQQRKEQDQGKK